MPAVNGTGPAIGVPAALSEAPGPRRGSRTDRRAGVRCSAGLAGRHEELLRVAPCPLLTRLGSSHDGVSRGAPVRGGMATRRVIAAADIAAGQALAEVHPGAALADAVDALLRRRRLDRLQVGEVDTLLGLGITVVVQGDPCGAGTHGRDCEDRSRSAQSRSRGRRGGRGDRHAGRMRTTRPRATSQLGEAPGEPPGASQRTARVGWRPRRRG